MGVPTCAAYLSYAVQEVPLVALRFSFEQRYAKSLGRDEIALSFLLSPKF